MKNVFKVIGWLVGVLFILLILVSERDKSVEDLIPKYANKTSQFMPILGMQVHYRDQGIRSDSVPIILLHGMSSSLHTWDSVAFFYLPNEESLVWIYRDSL